MTQLAQDSFKHRISDGPFKCKVGCKNLREGLLEDHLQSKFSIFPGQVFNDAPHECLGLDEPHLDVVDERAPDVDPVAGVISRDLGNAMKENLPCGLIKQDATIAFDVDVRKDGEGRQVYWA